MPAVCGVQRRQQMMQGASTRAAGRSAHLEYGCHLTVLSCTWLIKLAGQAGCSLSHPRSAVPSDVPLHRHMHSHYFTSSSSLQFVKEASSRVSGHASCALDVDTCQHLYSNVCMRSRATQDCDCMEQAKSPSHWRSHEFGLGTIAVGSGICFAELYMGSMSPAEAS